MSNLSYLPITKVATLDIVRKITEGSMYFPYCSGGQYLSNKHFSFGSEYFPSIYLNTVASCNKYSLAQAYILCIGNMNPQRCPYRLSPTPSCINRSQVLALYLLHHLLLQSAPKPTILIRTIRFIPIKRWKLLYMAISVYVCLCSWMYAACTHMKGERLEVQKWRLQTWNQEGSLFF